MQRLEAPPLLAALEDGVPVGVGAELLGRGRGVARIGGAVGNPAFEVGEDAVVEFGAVFGHLEVGMRVADALQEEGSGGIARNDGGPGVAAFLPARAGVEQEAALAFGGGAVALVAFLGKDGANAGFEELDLRGRGGGRAEGKEPRAEGEKLE